jgi:hypothetical protein
MGYVYYIDYVDYVDYEDDRVTGIRKYPYHQKTRIPNARKGGLALQGRLLEKGFFAFWSNGALKRGDSSCYLLPLGAVPI